MLDSDTLKVGGGAGYIAGALTTVGVTGVTFFDYDIAETLAEPVGFLITIPFLLAIISYFALHMGNDQSWGDMSQIQQALAAMPVAVLTVHQWVPDVNDLIYAGDPAMQGVAAVIVVGTGIASAFAGDYL